MQVGTCGFDREAAGRSWARLVNDVSLSFVTSPVLSWRYCAGLFQCVAGLQVGDDTVEVGVVELGTPLLDLLHGRNERSGRSCSCS